MFSVMRLYANSILPNGNTYTFWGKGVSQGHSDAIRRIEGVKDARQYTIPIEDAMNKVSVGKSFIRICNKSIIKEISKATKKRAEGEKFGVNYNPKEKLLEIDLNSPL